MTSQTKAQRRLRNPLGFIFKNPVAIKELRGRMRGPRAFVVLTGYLVVVGIFTLIVYFTTTSSLNFNNTGEIDGGTVGRFLFSSVVAMELFLVTFITPAFTASAISGEHEHQTYDLLRTTLLPEASLIWGKLFSALAYIVLLLLAAIPLQSIAFLFGGVDVPEVYVAFVTLMSTAILLGALGVYFSVQTRRTLRANIMTYVTAMAIAITTLMAALVAIAIHRSATGLSAGFSHTGDWLLLLLRGLFICLNPIATLQASQDMLINQQSTFTLQYTFQNGATTTLPAPWIIFSIFYITLSIGLIMVSIRRLKEIDD